MQIKATVRYHFTPTSKVSQILAYVGTDWDKMEPSNTVGADATWCTHLGKQPGGTPRVKHRISIWLSNPTLVPHPRTGTRILSKAQTRAMIAALFIPAPTGSNWRMNSKMWQIHTIEYYSPRNKSKMWTHYINHRRILKHHGATVIQPVTEDMYVT